MRTWEFKKYSNEQIEHALSILVKYNKIVSWSYKTQNNEDGYLIILLTENRSQRRILNNIPEEIDLNQVKTTPISSNISDLPSQEGVKSADEHQCQTQPIPTNNETQTVVKAEVKTFDDEIIDDGKPF